MVIDDEPCQRSFTAEKATWGINRAASGPYQREGAEYSSAHKAETEVIDKHSAKVVGLVQYLMSKTMSMFGLLTYGQSASPFHKCQESQHMPPLQNSDIKPNKLRAMSVFIIATGVQWSKCHLLRPRRPIRGWQAGPCHPDLPTP